jgi:hypothetical protein
MDWKIFLIAVVVVGGIPLILLIQKISEINNLKKKLACLVKENADLFDAKTKGEIECQFYRNIYGAKNETDQEAEKRLLDNIANWNPFSSSDGGGTEKP